MSIKLLINNKEYDANIDDTINTTIKSLKLKAKYLKLDGDRLDLNSTWVEHWDGTNVFDVEPEYDKYFYKRLQKQDLWRKGIFKSLELHELQKLEEPLLTQWMEWFATTIPLDRYIDDNDILYKLLEYNNFHLGKKSIMRIIKTNNVNVILNILQILKKYDHTPHRYLDYIIYYIEHNRVNDAYIIAKSDQQSRAFNHLRKKIICS